MNRSFTLKLAQAWLSKKFPDMQDYLYTLPSYKIIFLVERHYPNGWNSFLNNLNKL